MAVATGVGPHRAWLMVDGGSFPVMRGSVHQNASRQSSTFSVTIALSYPGAEATFATLSGNSAQVMVTARGMPATLLTGEVDNVSFDYVGRTIGVSGRCKSAKLHEKKSSEKWTNKKGSEIVSDLAGRAGLGVKVDASKQMAGKKVQQDYTKLTDGISYATVIHKLSEFDGARWFVDAHGILNYLSQSNPSGSYTINYVPPMGGPMRGDFLSLHVHRNVPASKGIKATVKSWHPKSKKVFTGEHTAGGGGGGGGIAGMLEYIYHIPNLEQDHAQQYAQSRASEHASHELKLSATLVGDPSINVAMSLQLTGTGFFDRTYEIQSISHEFGMSGYTMSISAKLPSAKSGGGGGGNGSAPAAAAPAAAAPAAGGAPPTSVPGGGTPL